MARKGENIFYRKDGRWEARYVKERDYSGKNIYGYVYGKTYQEVKNKRTEGTVKVIEWFKNDNFMERKRYTYYVRQRDGIWQIYDYTVDNLGTE